ncbi:DUF6326 family protein [Microbulbifer sp. JMSA003]|uniref:DUF6326 family protein n=1 Tax=Microbulbifer sp. JMSA003 TaxID=3243369 RepID=UPI0040399685
MNDKDNLKSTSTKLTDNHIDVKIKIAGLWASVVLLYIYGDFFGLFKTGKIDRIIEGFGPFGAVTQESLLAVSIIVSLPCIMVALTLLLNPSVSRWINVVISSVFIIFLFVTFLMSTWYFYFYLGFIEIILKLAIIWLAWRWPHEEH